VLFFRRLTTLLPRAFQRALRQGLLRIFWSAWAILLIFLAPSFEADTQPQLGPPAAKKTSSLNLDKRGVESGEFNNIRVRIFPHKRDYLPHGSDRVQNRLRLVSDAPCLVFEGRRDRPGKGERQITRTRELYINAARLRVPVWVECEAPVRLERELGTNSYSYRGAIYVSAKAETRGGERFLQAINIVPLETYLEGVVPAEVSAGWPVEALKTQAVAARTYAIFHMTYARKYSLHPDFDVDDSIVFQVYTGIDGSHPRTDAAIKETSGQILMFNDEVIQAYYHADSGGHTASAGQMFNLAVPYCEGKQELAKVASAATTWRKMVSLSELNRKLAARDLVRLDNPVIDIQVAPGDKAAGGRVVALTLTMTNGEQMQLPVATFKRHFPINSLLFKIQVVANSSDDRLFELAGRGNGHGVGMNQKGAHDLVAHYGWDYEKILDFYYSGTLLCSIDMDNDDQKVPACSEIPRQWADESKAPALVTGA